MKHKSKKIFLNTDSTKYFWVKIFASKLEMQAFYKKRCDERGMTDDKHSMVEGVSLHYERINYANDSVGVLSNETGTVLLHVNSCGALVVSHEFLHAILWAWKHKEFKEKYPIIISNDEDEEEIAHNLTFAIAQFYRWYWKIESKLKNESKKN